MWLWFGQKRSVRRIEGGRVLHQTCPECGRAARFVECEVEEKLTAYSLLDLGVERETVFRCAECGELFRLEGGEARRQAEPERAAAERAEKERARAERAARERAEERRARAERDARVEDELAALKKKLGR